MTGGIIEAGAGSVSGSVIAYFILKLWKSIRRRIKIRGLIINDATNWEKIEPFSNEDIIFINVKKILGKDYPSEMSRSDVRLKVFPKAKQLVHTLKDQFKKKTIVFLSDDLELLNFMGVRNVHINTILPSEQFIQELHKINPQVDYNKMKLDVLKSLDKKHIHIIDNQEQIIGKVRDLFNVCLK